LFKAAAEAQKIFDFVLGMEQKREISRENTPAIEPASTLSPGDEIAYNNNVYRVVDQNKKSLKMEDLEGNKFNLKPTDGLYKKLVDARNNPAVQELVAEEHITHKIGR
jgi:hypothetical protein